MNLIEKLYNTYNAHTDSICDPNDKTPLYPIDHTSFNMNIKIILNTNGEFEDAKLIDKADSPTIIPCISLTRSAGIAPHPLCDKLEYVAGDFITSGGVTKKGEEKYSAYFDLLTGWKNFDPTNVKLSAIQSYVSKKRVIKDLIKSKIITTENGIIVDQGKEGVFKLLQPKSSIKNATVLWEVEDKSNPNSSIIDSKLQNSWIKYVASISMDIGLCYVTGEQKPLTRIHSSKIRSTGDKSKLISSNDVNGYTFRGDFFKTSEDAVGISDEVSQKAHSALRWLIRKQGTVGKNQLGHVAWGINTLETAPIEDNSFDFLFDDAPAPAYTAELFAKRLSNTIRGYGYTTEYPEDITILQFDTIGSARIGIKYYQELSGSDFIDRIAHWHTAHAWDQQLANNKNFYGSPSPYDIAICAYGERASDVIIEKTKNELFPCIVNKVTVPYHIVRACTNKLITTPKDGNTHKLWERTLRVTCGLLTTTEKKEDVMKLDHTTTNKDYLFGRLLAVAESAELAHNLKKGNGRIITHAGSLFSRYQRYPAQTWGNIHNAILKSIPHFGGKVYMDAIEEIMGLFSGDDFLSNKQLDPKYLIGYYTQREDLNK